MTYHETDYTDALGYSRRVLVPDDGDPAEGIPVSLDLQAVFPHMPDTFIRALSKACWARGLIKPCDFLKPGADGQFKSALLSIIKEDFLSVQRAAREECK